MLPTPELEIARNLPVEDCSVFEAERYTRWLATHHYENFSVVSWLLPAELHQHFYNVYSYCRWSDDLGDEVSPPARAIELLNDWERELRVIYEPGGNVSHPVLIALRKTIISKNIPLTPFTDLLRAFRSDQIVKRYPTWESVLDYCAYSANPVGRLVLHLCSYSDENRQHLSDHTCTALQLANFWQDVSRDLEKGRIYIPLDVLAAHGLCEKEIIDRCFDERYAAVMKSLIARTRELFSRGFPLTGMVRGSLRIDLELFSRGGLAILDSIEASGYNTLQQRPSLSKWTKMRLLGSALISRAFVGSAAGQNAGFSPRIEKESGTVSNLGTSNQDTGTIPANAISSRVHLDAEPIRASYAECVRVARESHSSFYLAFYGLRKEKREALCALYSFMRLVDNVSDEAGDIESKKRGLARWRSLLDESVAGETRAHAILPAFADTVRRFEIPVRYFHDLISGAEMDLTVATYATFDRLAEYCYRVAGTVGLTCLHVFGFRDPRAPGLAERLGLAFQLTNIIRDVPDDLEMGRVYLPQEDLIRFGCRTEDLTGPLTPQLRELLHFEAARAWTFYEEGAPLVQQVDSDSRATLWALVRTYSSLLARIEERDFQVFSSRVSLSSAEKLQSLLMAGMSGWWKKDALAKSAGDRRRSRGPILRRRAG